MESLLNNVMLVCTWNLLNLRDKIFTIAVCLEIWTVYFWPNHANVGITDICVPDRMYPSDIIFQYTTQTSSVFPSMTYMSSRPTYSLRTLSSKILKYLI